MTDLFLKHCFSSLQWFNQVQEQAENVLREILDMQRRGREQQTELFKEWINQVNKCLKS